MKLCSKKPHNKSMKLYQSAVLLVLLSISTFAQAASWYQVEMVVFDRLYPNLDGERWPDSEFEPRSNMIELKASDNAAGLVPFMQLSASRHRLEGIYRYFRLSSDYRPLVHVSWQQPATDRRNSRFVHISRIDPDSGSSTIKLTDQTDTEEPEFIEGFIQPDRIIDGAVRIRSGFYLHIDLDLNYFKELLPQDRIIRTADALAESDKTVVKLKETRKIKLNEIHYFDHPMFGAIIQVSRL